MAPRATAAGESAGSVVFHTGVPDVLDYVCRLARKAVGRETGLIIRARADQLRRLDERLWTFDREGFLPHGVWPTEPDAAVPAPVQRAPIWLVTDWPSTTGAERVRVNLGPDAAVEGCAEGEWGRTGPPRIIEVVGSDDGSRTEGQRRWKLYRQLGWLPEHRPYGSAQ